LVARESRVRITIIEDVAIGTNIARIIILAETKRKYPKSTWQSKPKGSKSSNTTIDGRRKISSLIEGPEINYYR
jgi:hypothetical protein